MLINKKELKETIKNSRFYYDNKITAIKAGYDEFFTDHTYYGQYPILFLSENPYSILCATCAKKEYILHKNNTLSCDIYYEGETLFCDDCGKEIKSAYGNPYDVNNDNSL